MGSLGDWPDLMPILVDRQIWIDSNGDVTVVIVAVAVKTTVTTYDKVISKKWRERESARETDQGGEGGQLPSRLYCTVMFSCLV